jgi:hypothetical protein
MVPTEGMVFREGIVGIPLSARPHLAGWPALAAVAALAVTVAREGERELGPLFLRDGDLPEVREVAEAWVDKAALVARAAMRPAAAFSCNPAR